MGTAERTIGEQTSQVYDGFISYSHAADDLLAPRLQAGLQRFAKAWWKRRALRIFRDESSLSANPHLWSSITEALDQSSWFVLLLSPEAAQSDWVNQEIGYWKEHNDPTRILPVLTDGTFQWSGGDVSGTAVPEQLHGVFSEEPRWVDLGFAREEDQLDLKNPRFSSAVADIASALRGIPKDELESEEVRQHRRTIRTAWAAGALVVLLGVAASIFAIQASTERGRAEANAAEAQDNAELAGARELAASAIGVVGEDPELATLLALEAIDRAPGEEEIPIELENALWAAGSANRLLGVVDPGYGGRVRGDLSADGTRLVVSSEAGTSLTMWDTGQLDSPIWELTEETADSFNTPSYSPDGRMVAVSVLDSESHEAQFEPENGQPDDLPNRILIVHASSGELVTSLEYPECVGVDLTAFSHDGSLLAVGSGYEGCPREGAGTGQWIEVFDTATWEPIVLHEFPDDALGPAPVFNPDGRLYAFSQGPLQVFEPSLGEEEVFEAISGFGDVTKDGSLIAAFVWPERNDLIVFDGVNGEQLDLLTPWDSFPRRPQGIAFSPDGTYITVGTEGETTHVFRTATGIREFDVQGGTSDQAMIDVDTDRLFTAHNDGLMRVWEMGSTTFGIEPAGDLGSTSWVNGNNFTLGDEVGTFAAFDLGDFLESGVGYNKFFDLSSGDLLPWVLEARGNQIVAFGDGRFAYTPEPGYWFAVDMETGQETYLIGCPGDAEEEFCVDTGEPFPNHLGLMSLDGSEFAAIEIQENEDGSVTEYWTLFDPVSLQVAGSEEHLGAETPIAYTSEWIVRDHHDGRETFATDRSTDETIWSVEASGPFEVSPSGEWLAVTEFEIGVTVIDLETGDYHDIPGDFGSPRGMGFSPDESILALGNDAEVVLLDLDVGEVFQRIPVPGVSDFYWLDDETLVIGSKHGVWGRLSLQIEDLVASARQSLFRSFTMDECVTYRIDPCPTLAEVRSR